MNWDSIHPNVESHRVIKRRTSESVEAFLVHEFVSFLLDTCDAHLYFDYCMEWRLKITTIVGVKRLIIEEIVNLLLKLFSDHLNVGNFFERPISKISI